MFGSSDEKEKNSILNPNNGSGFDPAIIIIGIAALAVIGGGGYLIYNSMLDNQNKNISKTAEVLVTERPTEIESPTLTELRDISPSEEITTSIERNAQPTPTQQNQSVEHPKPKPQTGLINGHEYIDLGLSVKWATCNVGANRPSEYGSYFAWGETKSKSSYHIDNGLTYNRTISDYSGNANYDAATSQWGETWRTPTYDEFTELCNKCKWKWTSVDGKNGYKVTAPNGRSIFLPAAGWDRKYETTNVGIFGYYWTSTPNANDRGNAQRLYFYNGDRYLASVSRYEGLTVRPVSD